MITLNKYADRPNRAWLELYGLSSDEKPTESFEGKPIGNASIYVEMDTSQIYVYDEENSVWYPLVAASGGGGGGGSSDVPADVVTRSQLTAMLKSYVTSATLTTTLNSYSTTSQIANTYVTSSDFNSTMQNYSTTQEIQDTYVEASSFEDAMSNVQQAVEETHMTSKTATLTDEALYIWNEMRELIITIPQNSGLVYFRFVSGSTPTTLSITGAVMPDDFVVEANRVYDVSVLDGYASVVSWAAN